MAAGPGALVIILGHVGHLITLLDAMILPPNLLILANSMSARKNMVLDRKVERTVVSGRRGNLWRGPTVKAFPSGSRFSVCRVSGSVTSDSHGITLFVLFRILSPPQQSYPEEYLLSLC